MPPILPRLSLSVVLLLSTLSAPALAAGCADAPTVTPGTLTLATGNPAYAPWVLDDAPEAGRGFEAAVAAEMARRMGFAADRVAWVRTSFDEAIQPGAKTFDLNLQQFSITADRDKVVDFTAPYYSAAMAVLVTGDVAAAGAVATTESLKALTWGAVAGTTGATQVAALIAPVRDPLLYNDNADVTAAMQAGQVDAALFDLPTALYLAAAVLDGGVVLGQFPADRTENPDRFGALMPEGSALKACADGAIAAMDGDGTLAALEAEWLQEGTGIPVIE